MAENQGSGKEDEKEDEKSALPDSDSLSEIIPKEVYDAIPEEDRGRISKVVSQLMISSSISRPRNPIAEKVTTNHITQIITNTDEQDKRDREDKQRDRYYNAFIFIASIIVVGGLIVFLREDKELLEKVITALLSFGAGFGVGKVATSKKES